MILNPQFDISGEMELLDSALQIAFSKYPQAHGWRIQSRDGYVDRIIFYWAFSESSYSIQRPPAPVNKSQVRSLIEPWLESVDYGEEPGTDGSTDKGFRLYNETYGDVNYEWQTFFAIEPYWLVYGK